jgi:type I restriction enzyme M protein
VNFTKYFYKYQPLRSLLDITNDLVALENQTDGLMAELLENE